jgi:hypothetical protein
MAEDFDSPTERLRQRVLALAEQLLSDGGLRRGGLTELEKLAIGCIFDKTSYRQAGLAHQYTESSFQNAASRLFKDLSLILAIDQKLSRRNFVEVMGAEYDRRCAAEREREIVFDRLQAQLWLREKQARLVSISYQANQVLDVADYLVIFSPQFAATFCLNGSEHGSAVELLWSLCQSLQLTIPKAKEDIPSLLKLIGGALRRQKTLLMLRFDGHRPVEDHRMNLAGSKRLMMEYAQILVALGMMNHDSCLLILDADPVANEEERQRSLGYLLRQAITDESESVAEGRMMKAGRGALRLICLENDQQGIVDVMKAYIR